MKLGYWQEAVKAQQRTFVTVRLVDYGDLFWKDFIKFAHQESAAARVLTGAVAPSAFDECNTTTLTFMLRSKCSQHFMSRAWHRSAYHMGYCSTLLKPHLIPTFHGYLARFSSSCGSIGR